MYKNMTIVYSLSMEVPLSGRQSNNTSHVEVSKSLHLYRQHSSRAIR